MRKLFFTNGFLVLSGKQLSSLGMKEEETG